jgi:hypothetical protein
MTNLGAHLREQFFCCYLHDHTPLPSQKDRDRFKVGCVERESTVQATMRIVASQLIWSLE